MSFLLVLVAVMGLVLGAAVHTTMPVFLAACAAIAAWLLAFGVREGVTRLKHH